MYYNLEKPDYIANEEYFKYFFLNFKILSDEQKS